jgi:hypothetical protein
MSWSKKEIGEKNSGKIELHEPIVSTQFNSQFNSALLKLNMGYYVIKLAFFSLLVQGISCDYD